MDDLDISVTSIRPVIGSRLTRPVEQELEKLFQLEVEADEQGEPPAAGFLEIACVISVGGAVPLLIKFFEPLVTAAGESFRNRVLALITNGKRNKTGDRRYVPLRVEFGTRYIQGHLLAPVRYYFHGNPDHAELLLMLEKARDHIQALEPDVFSATPYPPEFAFYWDASAKQWRGALWISGAEPPADHWMPRNLFDD